MTKIYMLSEIYDDCSTHLFPMKVSNNIGKLSQWASTSYPSSKVVYSWDEYEELPFLVKYREQVFMISEIEYIECV